MSTEYFSFCRLFWLKCVKFVCPVLTCCIKISHFLFLSLPSFPPIVLSVKTKTKWRMTGLCPKQTGDWLASKENKIAPDWPQWKTKMAPDWPQLKTKMVPDWPQLKTKWRLTGLNEKKNGHRLGSVLNKIMTDLHLFKIKWLLTGLCRKKWGLTGLNEK